MRTTFGPTCSPIGKAIAFADVYYHNTIYASFGPGEYPLVVVRHIKKGTFVVMKEGSCFYIYLYTTISIFIENIKVACAPESISRSCFTVASGVLLLSEERGKQDGSIFRANLYLVYVATNKNRTHAVYKE
jgi:hypothetical protein